MEQLQSLETLAFDLYFDRNKSLHLREGVLEQHQERISQQRCKIDMYPSVRSKQNGLPYILELRTRS